MAVAVVNRGYLSDEIPKLPADQRSKICDTVTCYFGGSYDEPPEWPERFNRDPHLPDSDGDARAPFPAVQMCLKSKLTFVAHARSVGVPIELIQMICAKMTSLDWTIDRGHLLANAIRHFV